MGLRPKCPICRSRACNSRTWAPSDPVRIRTWGGGAVLGRGAGEEGAGGVVGGSVGGADGLAGGVLGDGSAVPVPPLPSSVGAVAGEAGAVVARADGCRRASAPGSCGPHPAARAAVTSTPAVTPAARLPRRFLRVYGPLPWSPRV
ncbi:hypothetical protein GCM10010298_54620 [Streptomyces microflavus]|uniref:Uncharacterized protein n=1 Tax=Streptomyces microflavus TaxID=1919 RepID=A0A7J0CXF8_STRMI|nr:hypothetical protein Smic_51400 [Streptomyces microflavus]GGX82212.1 hypothetical protein GCM10010298_54620 [Streptomyces microflavus]